MKYQFFLCKPSSLRHYVSRTLLHYIVNQNAKINWSGDFLPFDIERIRAIQEETSRKSTSGMPLFRLRQLKDSFSSEPLPIYSITTEYSLAQKVIGALSKRLKGGLVLFDAEMDCLDAISEISQRDRLELVTMRLAHSRYCKILRQSLISAEKKVLVSIYKIGDCMKVYDEDFHLSSVVDTSIALMRGELPSVAKQLFAILSENAKEHGESVYCKDGCFIVENKKKGYRLRFVLEGTGKAPIHLCWIENGEVKTELLHRMGVYRTRKEIVKMDGWENACEEEYYIRSRLYFSEAFYTRPEWRNPADRFVDSYKISRLLKKNNMGLAYGHHLSKSPNEVCFCEGADSCIRYDSDKTESGFMITEEEAAPLFALVESVIPYYYNYYYDIFHVRREEVEPILVRLKEVRAIVAKNPLDESLGKIGERLLTWSWIWSSPSGENSQQDWGEQKKSVLYSHRRELVALYDFFEWWLMGGQRDCQWMDDGFRIIGP